MPAPMVHPLARVALETTLLLHGVPRGAGLPLARELNAIVRSEGAVPALVGLVGGVPRVGMTEAELEHLLAATDVPKVNTSNLGALMHRRSHGATTVSATMELAASAGVRTFATGGLGGVHGGMAERLDISADLGAFTRHPVAVVASGVKSILDVASTRELLETIGVCVVGFRTSVFPAFYIRETELPVDARYDDERELADFLSFELNRSGRGVLVCNPVPQASALKPDEFEAWLAEAAEEAAAQGVSGRAVTPFVLGRLHERSGGRTLAANLDLVRSNTRLAAKLARLMAPRWSEIHGPDA